MALSEKEEPEKEWVHEHAGVAIILVASQDSIRNVGEKAFLDEKYDVLGTESAKIKEKCSPL